MWWSTPSPGSFCGVMRLRECCRAKCLCFAFPHPYARDKQVNLWHYAVLQWEQTGEQEVFCGIFSEEPHPNGEDTSCSTVSSLLFSYKKSFQLLLPSFLLQPGRPDTHLYCGIMYSFSGRSLENKGWKHSAAVTRKQRGYWGAKHMKWKLMSDRFSPKFRSSSIRTFKQFPFNATEMAFKQLSRYHMHPLQFYWVLLASTAEFGLATICLEAWKKTAIAWDTIAG